MSTTNETWLPVVGYEGLYEVSDHGNVRSLDRVVRSLNQSGPYARRIPARLLKQIETALHGRPYVNLASGGKRDARKVHHLVLEAFVGPRPLEHEAAHSDGNRRNNHLSNLRWDTHKQNIADKKRHGTHQAGIKHPNSKLTDDNVREMRLRRALGQQYKTIGAAFGVSKSVAHAIVSRKRWGHVS